ncbi:MAG TPA: hypothetical protein VIJ79_15110 [Acidobacteriaceae bacterium]
MSRTEVVQKIGKSAIVSESKDDILFSTVPIRNLYFESYDCFFDQNGKLWAIHAWSKPMPTKSEGEDLRDSFDTLKTGLEHKYGKVLFVTGSRTSGIKWMDIPGPRKVFMGAYWDGSGEYSRSMHIDKIALELEQTDKDHGFIELNYEFNTMIEDSL